MNIRVTCADVHEDGIFIAPAYEHEEENYGIVIGYEFNFSN